MTESCIVYVEKQLPLGEIPRPEIGISRQFMEAVNSKWIPYKHFGIAIGNDQVIHFSGDEGIMEGAVRVRLASKAEFSLGETIYIDTPENVKFSNQEIINKAMGRIGSDFGGFNLLDNNSETFALWCATRALFTRQNFGLDIEQLLLDIEKDREAENIVPIFIKQQRRNLQGLGEIIPSAVDECSMFNYLNQYYHSVHSDLKH